MIKLERKRCAILSLVLKGKWYDLIASGVKREEYRAACILCSSSARASSSPTT